MNRNIRALVFGMIFCLVLTFSEGGEAQARNAGVSAALVQAVAQSPELSAGLRAAAAELHAQDARAMAQRFLEGRAEAARQQRARLDTFAAKEQLTVEQRGGHRRSPAGRVVSRRSRCGGSRRAPRCDPDRCGRS